MSTRWISPDLRGLLEELAQSPASVLFGTAAGVAEAQQRRLPSNQRAPGYWSGRENGLLNAEKQLLRAHREEVAHLVRQISFALSRRIPGLLARLDPVQDRLAQSRALPRSTQLSARRSLLEQAQPRSHQQEPAIQLLLAADPDLTTPEQAIPLLHQAQRLAPHAMTLQHTGFWLGRTGQLREAREALLCASQWSASSEHFQASETELAWVELSMRSCESAGERYKRLHTEFGGLLLLASGWCADVLRGDKAQAEATASRVLAETDGSSQQALRTWGLSALVTGIDLQEFKRGLGTQSASLLRAVLEENQ